MLVFNDQWDFVFDIDESDISQQKLRYFNGKIHDYGEEAYYQPYSLSDIVKNVSAGSWKIVDEEFFKRKTISLEPINKTARIEIDLAWGKDVFRIVTADKNKYILVDEENFNAYDVVFEAEVITMETLKKHITTPFRILEKE